MKHVARQVNNKRKCFVAYRVVPNDPNHCLVVFSDSLEAADHDALVGVVESNAGQTAYELAEAMHRSQLPDGRNMLVHFNRTGKLVKMPSSEIEMIPNFTSSVNLAELNSIIAKQKGVAVEDLALGANQSTATTDAPATTQEPAVAPVEPVAEAGVITDEQLAAQYRSQADSLFKEAKRLREQAEELVPTKKKSTKTKESA